MPELPDVEVFRRYFKHTSLNKKILRVDINAVKMLRDVSSGSLRMNLKNTRFIKTSRHAKYLFAFANNGKILVLHFGMTGSLKYYKNDEQKPEHTRMLITFTNGYHLAYNCPRKLGKIFLVNDKQKFISNKQLGPDPLSDNFNLTTFRELLEGKRGTIKATLMDQKTISGIGNIYSDEILFNSNIHPASKTEKLNDDQVKKIYHMMRKILQRAIKESVEVNNIPRTYLLPNRVPGEDCPRCKGKIRKKTIAGRSAYFCDNHQKKIK